MSKVRKKSELVSSGMPAQESHRRSIAKAISWRAAALIVTVSLVWVVTGEAGFAATVGAVDSLIKLFVYYVHERAWIRFGFGRLPKENSMRSLETCPLCQGDLHLRSDAAGKYLSCVQCRYMQDSTGEPGRPEEKSTASGKAQSIEAHAD